MSYFKLIDGINTLLKTDSRIKTITEGDIDDLDQFRQNIPTLAHIIVSGGTTEDNLNIYDVTVSVLDIVTENNNLTVEKFKGNDNRQEVYNDTDNIIRHFYMRFRKQSESDNLFISGQPTFEKVLEDSTVNRLAGWDLSFQVGVPDLNINSCQVV